MTQFSLRLQEILETMAGRRGDRLQHAVRFKDLGALQTSTVNLAREGVQKTVNEKVAEAVGDPNNLEGGWTNFLDAVNAALSEADRAGEDAAAAVAKANEYSDLHDALRLEFEELLGDYPGTLQELDDKTEDVRADVEARLALVSSRVARPPATAWTNDPNDATGGPRPDLRTGTFVTDATLGPAYDFGTTTSENFGPKSTEGTLVPANIYRVRAAIRATSDGTGAGVKVRLGILTRRGEILVEGGRLAGEVTIAVADGKQIVTAYASTDVAALDAYGIPPEQQIDLSGSVGATSFGLYLRQNTSASAPATDGTIRVGFFETADVSAAAEAVKVLRTEIASSYDDATAGYTNAIAALTQPNGAVVQKIEELNAVYQPQLALLSSGIVSPPAALWTEQSAASLPLGTSIRPPANAANFTSADAVFATCYRFPDTGNRVFGQAVPVPYVPGNVYEVTATFRVLSGPVAIRPGISLSRLATAEEQLNIQPSSTSHSSGAGVIQRRYWFTEDGDVQKPADVHALHTFTGTVNATHAWFHIRQNGGDIATAGRAAIRSIEVRDVTARVRNSSTNANIAQNYVANTALAAATAALQTRISAEATRVSETVSGYQITLDDQIGPDGVRAPGSVLDLIHSKGPNTTIAVGPAAVGQQATLIVRESGPYGRITSGTTNGAAIEIPRARSLTFSARRLKISILAAQPATNGSNFFGIAYSTADNGNSGFLLSEKQLTPEYKWHNFFFDVPEADAGGPDYLGIFGQNSQEGRGVQIARIVMQVSPDYGDLPEVTDLSATVDQVLGADVNALDGTAYATMLTKLGARANGTLATIETFSSAISKLNGEASTAIVLRGSTNGATAQLGLYAWDNKTGSGSSILLAADDIIAKGTLSSDRLVVGMNRNLLNNADFQQGAKFISYGSDGSSGSQTELRIRAAGETWTNGTDPVLDIFQSGTNSGGYGSALFREPNTNAGWDRIPVRRGTWIEFSAYASAHRARGYLTLNFYDASGNYIPNSYRQSSFVTAANSSSDPTTWQRPFIIAEVPADAVSVQPSIRKEGTNSGSTSHLFVWRPMLAETTSSASQPSPFSPAGTTLIDGGRVIARTVIADALMSKTITAASGVLGDAAVNTLQIAGRAVTLPVRVFEPGRLWLYDGSTRTAATLWINRAGHETDLFFSTAMDAVGYGGADIMLYRENTLLVSQGSASDPNGRRTSVSFSFTDTNGGSGWTEYSVRIKKPDPATTQGADADTALFNRYFAAIQYQR